MPETDPAATDQPDAPADTAAPAEHPDIAKWKALARKHEQTAKANAEAARKLAELEDRDKSAADKAAEQSAAAIARAEKAERELVRLRVASEKGLTPAQAKRLVGNTEDELAADADELLADLKPSAPPAAAATRRPTETLSGGGDPAQQPEELDPDKLAAAVTAQH